MRFCRKISFFSLWFFDVHVCVSCLLFICYKKNVADDYGELLVDASSWFWWLSSFIALKWLLLSSASSLLLQFFHFIWLYGIKKAKKKIKIFPHSNHRNIIMWSTFFGSNQVKFFFYYSRYYIWFKFLMSISVYVLFYNPIQFFFVFFILFVSFSSPSFSSSFQVYWFAIGFPSSSSS